MLVPLSSKAVLPKALLQKNPMKMNTNASKPSPKSVDNIREFSKNTAFQINFKD